MPVAGATGATVAVKVTVPDTFGSELEVRVVVVELGEGCVAAEVVPSPKAGMTKPEEGQLES
jgi:hypothetical protein